MSCAVRNRRLKKLIQQAFAGYEITVRGSRGTAYGWVRVHIGYNPRNIREAQELRAEVQRLIKAANIEIGIYGYDDPGSDYGYGSKINIDFERCREQADGYGPDAWKQHLSREDWDALQGRQ